MTLPAIGADDFAFVAGLLRRRAGIVIEPGKEYLVGSRLSSLARLRKYRGGIPQLMEALRAAPDRSPIVMDVVDAMTTNETYFFRDQNLWQAFQDHALQQVVSRPETLARVVCRCVDGSGALYDRHVFA
ncbi:MAG: hypothetical protein PF961_03480 [Planctomycetota bacterium]|jgi:chemotaxis protein methyltransferase CheR|nr:hypothetical protein [Planctomycetota bacterium]